LQKPQPALKRADVVVAFRAYVHDGQAKMKNAGLSDENPFCATPPIERLPTFFAASAIDFSLEDHFSAME